MTLWSPCALKHVMWQHVFLGASEFKVRNLIWNGSFCNLCPLALVAGVTYLRYTVLMSPNKGETAVHCYDPPLLVLVMLVSRNIFHVLSALQSIARILKTLKVEGLVVSLSGITRLIKKPRLTGCHVCLLLQVLPNTTVELNSFLGHFEDNKYFLPITLTREATLCPNVLIFYNLAD